MQTQDLEFYERAPAPCPVSLVLVNYVLVPVQAEVQVQLQLQVAGLACSHLVALRRERACVAETTSARGSEGRLLVHDTLCRLASIRWSGPFPGRKRCFDIIIARLFVESRRPAGWSVSTYRNLTLP